MIGSFDRLLPRGITVNPGDTLANKNDSLSQGTFSFRHFSSFNFVLINTVNKTNADDFDNSVIKCFINLREQSTLLDAITGFTK